jgi:hypothetical protein
MRDNFVSQVIRWRKLRLGINACSAATSRREQLKQAPWGFSVGPEGLADC